MRASRSNIDGGRTNKMSIFTRNLSSYRAGKKARKAGNAFSTNPCDVSSAEGTKYTRGCTCLSKICYWAAGYWSVSRHSLSTTSNSTP